MLLQSKNKEFVKIGLNHQKLPQYDREIQDYIDRYLACQNNQFFSNRVHYSQIEPNLTIIRDDMLFGGTKSRYVIEVIHDHLKKHPTCKEIVSICQLYGSAQIALSWGIKIYNQLYDIQLQAIIITDPYEGFLPYPAIAKNMGAKYYSVLDYEKMVNQYTKERLDNILLSNVFEHPLVATNLFQLAKQILAEFDQFDEFWYTSGLGILMRAVENSGLAKVYYAIPVTGDAHIVKPVGQAIVVPHDQDFSEIAHELPPYSSAGHYDAKGWQYVWRRARDRPDLKILFWNVI